MNTEDPQLFTYFCPEKSFSSWNLEQFSGIHITKQETQKQISVMQVRDYCVTFWIWRHWSEPISLQLTNDEPHHFKTRQKCRGNCSSWGWPWQSCQHCPLNRITSHLAQPKHAGPAERLPSRLAAPFALPFVLSLAVVAMQPLDAGNNSTNQFSLSVSYHRG